MTKIKVFRCRICGDPCIGSEAPKQCPYCGAAQRFFIEAQDWNPDEFNVKFSDVSRKNLEAALQLELDNAAFYDCAINVADKAGDQYSLAKFKALMKVEREHASAISKFLKISRPELEKQACNADSKANSKEGFEREDRAIKAYAKFRDEATEPRLKEFFGALVEIETGHLDLHAEYLK
ncbi:MAG: ferritin-like domain-containing protein [Thermoplasmatales archaeon]|nr:ferritin-like domain-containing protein [Thermoplasmatales archaeon]